MFNHAIMIFYLFSQVVLDFENVRGGLSCMRNHYEMLLCRLTLRIFFSYVGVRSLTWKKQSQKGYLHVIATLVYSLQL